MSTIVHGEGKKWQEQNDANDVIEKKKEEKTTK